MYIRVNGTFVPFVKSDGSNCWNSEISKLLVKSHPCFPHTAKYSILYAHICLKFLRLEHLTAAGA